MEILLSAVVHLFAEHVLLPEPVQSDHPHSTFSPSSQKTKNNNKKTTPDSDMNSSACTLIYRVLELPSVSYFQNIRIQSMLGLT